MVHRQFSQHYLCACKHSLPSGAKGINPKPINHFKTFHMAHFMAVGSMAGNLGVSGRYNWGNCMLNIWKSIVHWGENICGEC